MQGRRFSDGLHQAIEAKEGVKVENESKTLATITFQNYFRMYSKLSGMTGTAYTEESEFRSIYNLDVIQIPTNRPLVRVDEPDSIFKSQKGKITAVLNTVIEAHKRGQPVLVGTVNVDKSELFSKVFSKAGIKHNVLNAKNHLREAEIVAQAGRFGSVTIATNMAGRGTDILLGGNPEYMAKQEMRKLGYSDELIDASTAHNETDDQVILESRQRFAVLEADFKKQTQAEAQKVIEAGGLLIIGTERHESRRIDNQLMGRAGRQGDPGRTKFYLALDDDLMRLFGGERSNALFNRLGVDDSMELQSRALSSQMESAQKKIEGLHFSSRKHVLEYDDVMNVQRNLTYDQRRRVLHGEDIHDTIIKMIKNVASSTIDSYSLDGRIQQNEAVALAIKLSDLFGNLPLIEEIRSSSSEIFASEEIEEKLIDQCMKLIETKEALVGHDVFREAERQILLYNVDQKWMDHIDAMDQLRTAIGMQSVGQKDPVLEYRLVGSEMFEEMNGSIQNDTVRMIMRANISQDQRIESKKAVRNVVEGHGSSAPTAAPKSAAQNRADQRSSVAPVKRDSSKVGRNDPCTCGSGKKYKNCCGKES